MTHFWIHRKPTWRQQHNVSTLATRAREGRRIAQALLAKESGERFLLCRPKAGLNDSLCQIQKAIIHSLRFRRHLLIDSLGSGLRDQFSNYFRTVHRFRCIDTELGSDALAMLNRLSCHPEGFTARLATYQLRFDSDLCNFVDQQTGQQPCLPIDDPKESVVLHDQCGGGRGIHCLAYFKLCASIADTITTRIGQLPDAYTAIHIRYADVPFALEPFLHSLREPLAGRDVLICTDSFPALTLCRSILSASRVIAIADIPDCGGQKLHDNPAVTNPQVNLGVLTDLLALALARVIIFPASGDVYPSGFSRLAVDLSSRDDLIRQLLGRRNWQRLHRAPGSDPQAGPP